MRSTRGPRLLPGLVLLLAGQLAVSAPARADEMLVRVYAATFNGTGLVNPPGDGRSTSTVRVSTYNDIIHGHECSVVAYMGNLPGDVASCSFSYSGSFTSSRTAPCTGTAAGWGSLTLYLPGGPRTYSFPDMPAVVTEGSGHGLATEVVDPDTGDRRRGYAEFSFVAPCGIAGPNTGRGMY